MEVISYKKCKNNLYEVYFNNGQKYKLYEDVIIEYELLINKNITNVKLKKILHDNMLLESYYKALKYINIKMRTEKEIELYLKKNSYNEDSIIYAIDKLKKNGYLNQELYVQAYINDAINLSYSGPKKIINDLEKLGISKNSIYKYLNYDNDFWMIRIRDYIDKKARINKGSIISFKNKIYSNLILLGYNGDDIKEVLDGVKIDTSTQFNKEADRLWNKIQKKEITDKAIWIFKNKMYSKGYREEEINNYINNVIK